MRLGYWAVTSTIRRLIRVLCRVDDAQVARVPDTGPLLVVVNHINFLEVPLIYTHMGRRPMTSFAKAETWDSPALRLLADLWGAIPLRRGEVDRVALRSALDALEKGAILFVAPEGTRSGDGQLQRGKPGVVLLALHSGAPLLPMVHYGGELFWDRLRSLRRTDVRLAVGQPFRLDSGGLPVTRQVRQEMTDEVMGELAALLPEAYRGAYSGAAGVERRYVRYLATP